LLQIVVGGVFIFLGGVLIGAGNMLHFQAEADLLEKRPELGDQFYSWGLLRKHHLIEKLYRSEFPHGKRIRQFWICCVAGMLTVLFGVAAIVTTR